MANHVEFSHLSYRTTEQTLLDYFSNYGRVDKLVLHRDDQEQSLRKGSLAYADMDSVDRLMSQRPHSIDGRPIVLRRTMPLATYSKSHCISEYFGMNLTVNEIFISRLCSGETRDLFVNYFQRFGRIVNCRVFNSSSRHSQQMGYAFVRFEDYDSVDRIILTRPHVINAKVYHTRKCIPREYNYISSSIKPLSYSKPTWRHYAFGLINMETQAITYPSIPRCVTQTVPIVSTRKQSSASDFVTVPPMSRSPINEFELINTSSLSSSISLVNSTVDDFTPLPSPLYSTAVAYSPTTDMM